VEKMKNTILITLAALGLVTSVSAHAVPPSEPFATANAELVCKIKSEKDRYHSTSGFTAHSGNYSINYGGAVQQSATLKQILENNSNFVTSAGGNIRNIPCSAAVAEVQRYVANAYLAGAYGVGEVGLPEIIVKVLTNLNTSNPGVTRLDDDTIVYTWTIVIPNLDNEPELGPE
jgi:hypothetical protein